MQATEHARVRILVVGDEAVGKSSLISTLVSHAFCERDVPPLMADVRIPREESSEGVETVIVDSSAARARRDALVGELARADSIVLVYDTERADTCARERRNARARRALSLIHI